MLMHIDVMKDASEIICYDRTGIPLHVRVGELSSFPDKKALCHWHDDIEFIRVLHGEMNYYINGRSILLKENNAIMVNSRQMHYSYSVQQKDCTFICILFHPSLFTGNKLLNQNYILPLLRNKNLEYLYFDLQNGDDGGILDLLDRISALREKSMDLYELEIVGLMHILWSRLYRQIVSKRLHTPEQDSNNSDIMLQKDMVSYIHQHYAER
ncbi:MAG: cupin domain-containing protein, partial [Clostridium sp.]|nr:cupin domain-containing protein [Clostridium sp.]